MPSSWLEIAEWDWVLLDDAEGDTLHAVGEVINDTEEDWFGDGRTVCGIQADMFIPGLFTRMSTEVVRCEACCDATGMPRGAMSPKNVDECRPICEARIAALASPRTQETQEGR